MRYVLSDVLGSVPRKTGFLKVGLQAIGKTDVMQHDLSAIHVYIFRRWRNPSTSQNLVDGLTEEE